MAQETNAILKLGDNLAILKTIILILNSASKSHMVFETLHITKLAFNNL